MGDDDFEAQMKGLVTDVKEYEKARCVLAPPRSRSTMLTLTAAPRPLWRRPTISRPTSAPS